MTVLLYQFVQSLSGSGLMKADELQSFLNSLPANEKPASGEDLGKLLFRHGKLTKFQVQAVLRVMRLP